MTLRKALQVVAPRAGIAAEVDIGLVGRGTIVGLLVKDGGGGFEGVDLELIDAGGKVAATARSYYDGYFLSDRAAYGDYTLRIAVDSDAAIHSAFVLDVAISVTDKRPSVRLGALAPTIPGRHASAAVTMSAVR
ncbi:MAG: hypothetical protein NVS3B5_20970 [Sphingomicrobium sp.]